MMLMHSTTVLRVTRARLRRLGGRRQRGCCNASSTGSGTLSNRYRPEVPGVLSE
jgi:hypothetical protein